MLWTILSEFFEKGLAPLRARWEAYRQETDFADQNEMLFEHREKRYGAYQLRKNYPWHLLTGVSVVSSAFLFCVMIPVWLAPPPPPADPVPQVKFVKVHFLPEAKSIIQTNVDAEMRRAVPLELVPIANQYDAHPHRKQYMELSLSVKELTTVEQTESIQNLELVGWEVTELGEEMEWEDDIPLVDALDVAPETIRIEEEEPKVLNFREVVHKIGYPQIAKDAGIDGMVVLRVLVDKNGTYKKHRVLSTPHPILSNAIEAQIDQLRFTPAYQGDKAIPFWVNVPFRFHTNN